MADNLTVKIENAKLIKQLLAELPLRIQKTAIRTGLSAGARIIRDDAKQLVPERSGGLRKSIKVVRRRGRRDLVVTDVVAFAPHAYIVEFGTVERFHKTGKSTGVMPSFPYMRTAFDINAERVVRAVSRRLIQKLREAQAKFNAGK